MKHLIFVILSIVCCGNLLSQQVAINSYAGPILFSFGKSQVESYFSPVLGVNFGLSVDRKKLHRAGYIDRSRGIVVFEINTGFQFSKINPELDPSLTKQYFYVKASSMLKIRDYLKAGIVLDGRKNNDKFFDPGYRIRIQSPEFGEGAGARVYLDIEGYEVRNWAPVMYNMGFTYRISNDQLK